MTSMGPIGDRRPEEFITQKEFREAMEDQRVAFGCAISDLRDEVTALREMNQDLHHRIVALHRRLPRSPRRLASPPGSPAKRRRTGAADEDEEEDEAVDAEEVAAERRIPWVWSAEPTRAEPASEEPESEEPESVPAVLPLHLLPRGGPRSHPDVQ